MFVVEVKREIILSINRKLFDNGKIKEWVVQK